VVEAGSHPSGDELFPPFLRYAAPTLRPELDYAYKSKPQEYLNNRIITYPRGKGLGGSSVLNFQVYLYGSSEDYNHWAELVGDDSWNWEYTRESFRKIENYEFDGSKAYSHLANPQPENHGTSGRVKVCLPPLLEKGIAPVVEAVAASGEKINLDFNSGDPLGIGIFPSSTSKNGRTTSATAHLVDAPDNLEIWTDATVHRLQFDGNKVVGIETADGRKGEQGSCSRSLLLLTAVQLNQARRLSCAVEQSTPHASCS
jgi:choline dehydrogenase-like flavoprotein